jgi:hypothetical protein
MKPEETDLSVYIFLVIGVQRLGTKNYQEFFTVG